MTNEEYKVWYEKTRNEMAEKMRDERAKLQQCEQEPVAWIAGGSGNLHWDRVEALADSDGWITPLYKEKNT